MAHEARAPRRGFLGTMLAALGAAWWPWGSAAPRARWEDPIAQPGGSARLEVSAPDARGQTAARVTLVITTPRETVRLDRGVVVLEAGRGALQVPLDYPYEELVAGRYAYHAEIQGLGQAARTTRPVRYEIREPTCFA